MNFERRAKKAKEIIEEHLNYTLRLMARHSVQYLGKEFNTAEGYTLKGKIQGLEMAIEQLEKQGIYL